jgi:hypothetical protein
MTGGLLIRYFLPEPYKSGAIVISDMNGTKELMNLKILATGYSQIEIDGRKFAPGTYTYSLISNNVIIDSKKMIIIGE